MSFKNKSIGTFFILAVYFSSCAHKTSPTGGPKDEDPPVLQLSVPENETLNYSSQKITLEFDEYIKLNNPKEEIIITPRLLGEYEIKIKKNRVVLDINDTLLSNTTYTINFREAIQDLNEGNSPVNLQLAFSTGNYLDSLTISGNVYALLTNNPGKDITISLYDAKDTLDIFNSEPIYFTKSNVEGEFSFNNLKNGVYKIYAISDKNKNLKLESKSETYAYLDKNVQLDSNISQMKLPLIGLDVTPLNLQSARTRGHYFVVKYNKYISSYDLTSILPDQKIPTTSFSKDHREIIYYKTNTISDSLGIIISAYDTISHSRIDTVYVKFEETKRDKDVFDITYSKISISKEEPHLTTEIQFTKPVQILNIDSIYLAIDSLQQIPIDTSDFKWNKQHTMLTINKSLTKTLFDITEVNNNADTAQATTIKPDKSFKKTANSESPQNDRTKNSSKTNKPTMYFGSASFISIEQDTSILHTEEIAFINPASNGIILVEVETEATSFFIQLLNNKGSIVSEKYNEKTFSFNNIKPGEHQIRVLIDQNGNGKWEIGDINQKTLPEPVKFYISEEGTSKITLRANWELGPIQIKF